MNFSSFLAILTRVTFKDVYHIVIFSCLSQSSFSFLVFKNVNKKIKSTALYNVNKDRQCEFVERIIFYSKQ